MTAALVGWLGRGPGRRTGSQHPPGPRQRRARAAPLNGQRRTASTPRARFEVIDHQPAPVHGISSAAEEAKMTRGTSE